MEHVKQSTLRHVMLAMLAVCAVVWTVAMLGPEHAPHDIVTGSHAVQVAALSRSSTVASATSNSADDAAMRARLAELEQRLSQLQQSLSAKPAQPQAPQSPVDQQAVERSDHAQQGKRAWQLDQEPEDLSWQTKAASQVEQAFRSSPEPDAVVLGTSCRSSHCRVQLDLEAIAPDQRQLAIARLMSALPWDGQAFYQPDTFGESGRGALYVTREGRQQFTRGAQN